MKLTPMGKLIATFVLIAVGAVAGAAGAAAYRPQAQEYRCVLVRPGDTLWQIARRADAGDVRPVIDKIVRRNGLAGAGIQPGMALWVPVEEASADLEGECSIVP